MVRRRGPRLTLAEKTELWRRGGLDRRSAKVSFGCQAEIFDGGNDSADCSTPTIGSPRERSAD